MTYFYVGFLKKNKEDVFSSDKSYLYKTRDCVYEGQVLDSFCRVDCSIPYHNKARVVRICSEEEAEGRNIDIKEVTIKTSHCSEDVRLSLKTKGGFAQSGEMTTASLNVYNPPQYNAQYAKREDLVLSYSPLDEHMLFVPQGKDTFVNANTTVKKEKSMNINSIFKNMNLDFGKVADNSIAYSVKGMAVGSNIGTEQESYKTYDGEITDVTGLVIKDMPLYKMPVAIKDIKKDDMVIHQGKPVIVINKDKSGLLEVVDVASATKSTIFPVKNVFGFNFYTKIVNLFADTLGGINENNPFGSMPFMLMLMDKDNGETNRDKSSLSEMLPLMMMMQGSAQNMNMNMNNLMLPLLMANENGGRFDTGLLLAFSMLNNNNGIIQPALEENN